MIIRLIAILLCFCFFRLDAVHIYDCFTFFNELELLKVRFEELYDTVDHFVLVEADQTFAGEMKPLFFEENKHLFERYMHKIIHIIVRDFSPPTMDVYQDRWIREEFQRNAMLRGLTQCNEDDVILISDLDEIPNRSAIDQVKQFCMRINRETVVDEDQLICQLHMRLFLFHLNCESPFGWPGAVKGAPYWLVKKRLPWNLKILHCHSGNLHKIYNAGWHFHSMCGSENRLIQKLRSIYRYPKKDFVNFPRYETLSEVENWEHHAQDWVHYSLSVFGYWLVPIEDSYPNYIINNLEEFLKLGWLR
jgi:hypothetical protein